MFSAEQNRALLIDLLSAVLRPASPITDLELLQREPEKDSADEKGSLDARGLAFPDEQRERIQACRDLQQLEQWTRRAVTASRADELFD